MKVRKQHMLIGTTALLITLGMGLYHSAYAAGVLAGSSRTVTRNLIVNGTAEASISITPVSTVLAGSYDHSNRQVLARYKASVTGGTLAIRFNPNVGQAVSSGSPTGRKIINSANSAQAIYVGLTYPTTQVIDGWRVFSEGIQEYEGVIQNTDTQTISAGTYPVAIDAVAWLY